MLLIISFGFWGQESGWYPCAAVLWYEVVSCASYRFQHPKEVVSHASFSIQTKLFLVHLTDFSIQKKLFLMHLSASK